MSFFAYLICIHKCQRKNNLWLYFKQVTEIFILSIIQGITEFLPVSSSSHLILVSEFLNFDNQSLSIDVSLHIGSFLAVVSFFHKEIINFYKNRVLFIKILVSSVPVMIIGFILIKTNLKSKYKWEEQQNIWRNSKMKENTICFWLFY